MNEKPEPNDLQTCLVFIQKRFIEAWQHASFLAQPSADQASDSVMQNALLTSNAETLFVIRMAQVLNWANRLNGIVKGAETEEFLKALKVLVFNLNHA